MPPKDMRAPEAIIFYNEAYEKEAYLRVRWTVKHADLMKNAAELKREPTNYYELDVTKYKMEGGLATLSRDHKVAANIKRTKPLPDAASLPTTKDLRHTHTLVSTGLGNPEIDPRLARPDTDLSTDPVMRPIDNKTLKLLYSSKPPCGREYYLQKRVTLAPEQKYYFPLTTNWLYGWRMGDSMKPFASEYGRHCLLMKNTSRVGMKPDPSYHASPYILADVNKCLNA